MNYTAKEPIPALFILSPPHWIRDCRSFGYVDQPFLGIIQRQMIPGGVYIHLTKPGTAQQGDHFARGVSRITQNDLIHLPRLQVHDLEPFDGSAIFSVPEPFPQVQERRITP